VSVEGRIEVEWPDQGGRRVEVLILRDDGCEERVIARWDGLRFHFPPGVARPGDEYLPLDDGPGGLFENL
jgi:hypothetical protein